MTQHTNQTHETARQRTAVTLRRALGTAAVALAGLLALPQAAEAQTRGPRGDGDRTEQRVAHLDEALDLSDAQATQLRTLFEAQKAGRPERGERDSADREATRAQREARRAEMDRQIGAVLTPAQLERYQALRASREGRRGDGRRGDGRRNGNR
ncbi:Spy/CpxP family protein refolding chaperone [Rubrivirga sp. S365]|uniref:Spy/CpxP family protein refolding chaperone n=1 Tax=Rubrivirga sp. S365 TaxID=3076080 RepID=UPI0028C766FB|nr:Spy/CpxP family protein refolding chaperone [Rubrivirga sp. S365]MDT7858396.1 Spy/CpxP family protein refolding chaperone [Rubrivirga sp. S365]